MEERTYTKREVRPQPKVGSLVVAFDFDDFKRQKQNAERERNNSAVVRSTLFSRTRRKFIYVHQDEQPRNWNTSPVSVGTIGVMVKGDGKGQVYVAFGGGVIGWVEVIDVAPLDWYERITASVQSND